MHRLEIPQVVEVVQLAFLVGLTARLPARHYTLKGGANLRFYEKSPRSSEDTDFDALAIEPWKLRDGVNAALHAPVVERLLRAQRIQVVETTMPKQTDTTQRWRIKVNAIGHASPISVTGEFSHRVGLEGEVDQVRPLVVAEPVDPDIAGRYGLPPVVLPHYRPRAAIQQKIGALARRAVNQPRDVFDLDWLLSRHREAAPLKDEVPSVEASAAAERATELDYPAFRDAVVPFIDADVRDLYDAAPAWNAMRERVLNYLVGLV